MKLDDWLNGLTDDKRKTPSTPDKGQLIGRDFGKDKYGSTLRKQKPTGNQLAFVKGRR
jgi:hypothetical protein